MSFGFLRVSGALLLFWLVVASFSAKAQPAAQGARARIVQLPAEAVAQDAGEYARQYGVDLREAIRRLRAQEESVAATSLIQQQYGDRLAGISVEHRPHLRIIVLLTGAEPVAHRMIVAGGMTVPILFRTGSGATRDQIVSAMMRNRARIVAALPFMQGMGFDGRTGELALLVRSEDSRRLSRAATETEVEALLGVPVRIVLVGSSETNLDIEGGSRVAGIDPADGRRYYCTTGFVVTDGSATGVLTAAHCPDALTYFAPDGAQAPLTFIGGWGARYQDVQIHASAIPQQPLFYADTGRTILRPVTGSRGRTVTRAGDFVCRRGETTGYSCAQVQLTDYAPPGELCGGPCDPTWVTVSGPSCRGGDSGGPIFNGTIAFGIVKGANYGRGGSCNFYFYMSTDFLPEGWSLLLADQEDGRPDYSGRSASQVGD